MIEILSNIFYAIILYLLVLGVGIIGIFMVRDWCKVWREWNYYIISIMGVLTIIVLLIATNIQMEWLKLV